MTGGIFGGGVIFVVAALLWAAVLVPSWVRRREFRAAERNAIRLQRTLRVLAETAEVPTEVRVEATAREALAREKLLRTAQRQQEAERKAQLSEARAAQVRAEIRAQQMKRKQAAVSRAARLRRPLVRRVRAFAALAALLALVGVLIGAGVALAGQGTALVLASASVVAAAMGALVLLAPGRVRVAEIPAEQAVVAAVEVQAPPVAVSDPRGESAAAAAHAAAQAAARARSEHARAMARARAERPPARQNQPNSILLEHVLEQARVDRASAEATSVAGAPTAQSAVSETESAPVVSSTNAAQSESPAAAVAQARSQQIATAERLRQMGMVGDTSEGMLDLDAVLRARRNAS
ncbi:hypothetical protein ACSHWG_02575 [Leucobacter sp. Z1108]|uniref:hypothetical protein n=1 Tax=Leucobacter sp. Z1108 TaxID=3439066 RepID=UPI003F31CDB4